MSIFRRIFFQNLILCFLLSSLSTFVICTQLADSLNQQQTAHLKQLNNVIDNEYTQNNKQLIKLLKNSFDYQSLKIEQLNGAVLHHSPAQAEPNAFSYQLLALLDKSVKSTSFVSPAANLRIEFILANQADYQLMDKLIYVSLVVILILLVITTISAQFIFKKTIKKTTEQFNHHLTEAHNDKAEPTFDLNFQSIVSELKPLTDTLDLMYEQLQTQIAQWKDSAESYQLEATRDELTGLPNRASFMQALEGKLTDQDDNHFGILAIVRATELQSLNQSRGYHAGDDYICTLAQAIKRVSDNYKHTTTFRINGSDFAIIIPSVTIKEAETLAKSLSGRFSELQKTLETNSIAYTGIVGFESGDSLGELLALSDTGISIAQTKSANAWHIQNDKSILSNVSAKYGNQNWKTVIDDVLENARVLLFSQPIQPTNKSAKVYSEILARFTNLEGQVLPTGSFVAMAEKMDKIIEIDKLIVDNTIKIIQRKNLFNQFFAINLTAKSAHDEQFTVWLERRLLRDSVIASKLVFELTEFGLQQNMAASQRFIKMLHRTGSRVTVERFGVGFTSFKFFREIKPDYIKLDGSYSRNIDDDKNNQYFVRIMVDLAHRLGVNVIAESVETENEKHTLEKIFVDGTQGYFIGKPAEL